VNTAYRVGLAVGVGDLSLGVPHGFYFKNLFTSFLLAYNGCTGDTL
jgi:hypothetical protein